MEWLPALVFVCAAFALNCPDCLGKRHRDNKNPLPPPLVGEDNQRKHRKSTECQFGSKSYELQDTWHPDLGLPFGVMYCFQCECVPIQKKRRRIGKVRCRNIKNECPKPTCDEPILRPGHCCKICPDDVNYQEVLSEDGSIPDYNAEEDKNANEFGVLLTGLEVSPPVAASLTGSGRFTFQKRNLHYSLFLDRQERLKQVRFVDEGGTILEEMEIEDKDTSKICGVWRKMPKVYRKLLRDEKIFVELITDGFSEGLIRGRLVHHRALATETFSSIMRPNDENGDLIGSGGIAVISTMSTTANVIHMLIIFNGIINEQDPHNVFMSVRVDTEDRNPTTLLEETIRVSKPNRTYNTFEWKIDDPTPHHLRLLALGKTRLTITNKNAPERYMSGRITPKTSCNVFQAVLLTSESIDESPPNSNAAGQAVLSFTEDGIINYKVNVRGLSSEVLAITLETTLKKKRKILDDFLPNLKDSWANGTFTKVTSRDIESLFREEMYINVATKLHESEIRGRVIQRLFSDAHLSDVPILLVGSNSSVAGQAWISVDSSCKLYYEVVVSSPNSKKNKGNDVHFVELVELPVINSGLEKRLLQEFNGYEIEDMIDDLSEHTLARLDSGVAFLQITRNVTSGWDNDAVELRGRIKDVRIPEKCKQDEDLARDGLSVSDSFNCVYNGKFYEDGAQWTAEHDSCQMCSCQRGQYVCEHVLCPKLQCPETVLLSGECCRTCAENSSSLNMVESNNVKGCLFEGDNTYRKPGQIWHPYIPPFGFSRCAVCICDAVTLKVNCTKEACPPLACSDKIAFRPEEDACCKQCPAVTPAPEKIFDQQLDEGSEKSDSDILAEGGCKVRGIVYPNGHEWHPRLQPYGEHKCINCSCKDGKFKCRRPKCPSLNCENRVEDDNNCCQKCAEKGSIQRSKFPSKKRKSKQEQ